MGKCVHFKSLITLADGQRVPAENLVGKQFELLTLVAHRIEKVQASASFNQIEPVYEIITDMGRVVIRNGDHPFWSADAHFGKGDMTKIRNPRWKKVKDFEVGDVIAAAEELPAFGNAEFSDDEVKIVAYLIGNGCLIGRSLSFTQSDGRFLDELTTACKNVGAKLLRRGIAYNLSASGRICRTATSPKNRRKQFAVNPIRNLMVRLGLFGKGSASKFIPLEFFQLSRDKMALFISRLYSTDGWASLNAVGKGQIGFCSISKRLVCDMQHMLQRFGIHARVSQRKTGWTPKVIKKQGVAYDLLIHQAPDVFTFCREIGIFGKEHVLEKFEHGCEHNSYDRSQWLHNHALPGTRWDRVKSIKILPAAQTVAIEVPHYHTYLTEFYEHNSHAGAWLINWWFDSFNPSGVICVAPRKEHLTSILWKDIRLQRMAARCNLMQEMMPKSPEMGNGVDHYARGITASRGEAVTGRHEAKNLFVIDEAVGVDPIYFTTIRTMFKPDGSCGWLAFCNPTSTTSQAYQEDQSGEWTVISLSCMDHPNIEAARLGKPLPVPKAVTVEMIDGWVHSDWCNPVTLDERKSTDFAWPKLQPGQPPESTKWFRPGGEMEARCLGVWPSQGVYGVWSDSLFNACLYFDEGRHAASLSELPQIGCDVARYGNDDSSFHWRWSALSLGHEDHNGWATTQTTGRLIELARELAEMVSEMRGHNSRAVKPEEIPIKIDDAGVGAACCDQLLEQGYNAIGVNAGSRATDESKYPNKRSELWFRTAALARSGLLCFAQLEPRHQKKIRTQAMAPTWKLDSAGRRVVEPKEETKKKIGHSPDAMDAVNLAYWESNIFEPGPVLPDVVRHHVMTNEWKRKKKEGRKLFGR